MNFFFSINSVMDGLLRSGYLADRKTAAAVYLAGNLKKPLLVEGPAGSGKTELARAIAVALNTHLVRLQCYPGLDESKALYEWNYQKQLLYVQSRGAGTNWNDIKKDIYTSDFLLARPVLKSLQAERPVVLLIDEIDKSEDELESFLLEALSEFQVTIPEYGTVKALHRPHVVLTSNNTREFSDALKRRCLHLYIPYPDINQEESIILLKIPQINKTLSRQAAIFVNTVRKMALKKKPGIAETLDWARALVLIGAERLEKNGALDTVNALLKYEDDIIKFNRSIDTLLPGPDSSIERLPSDNEKINNQTVESKMARFDF